MTSSSTKQVAAAADPFAARQQYADAVRQTHRPVRRRQLGDGDDIIDPADTRRVVITALRAAATKKLERSWRKHGVPPVLTAHSTMWRGVALRMADGPGAPVGATICRRAHYGGD